MEVINLTSPGSPVKQGDRYRVVKDNGTFKDHIQSGSTKSKVRKISIGAFRRRLTLPEKVGLYNPEDLAVKVLIEDLATSSFVDLDFPELIGALNYLEARGYLSPGRAEELLRDGDSSELP